MTSRSWSAVAATVVIVTVLAGCGGATPASTPVPAATATLAPSPSAPRPTPSPSIEPSATASAIGAPIILPGEPWLLYAWFLPGKDTKDVFLVRPDGTDAHPIALDVPGEHAAPSWSTDGTRIVFVVRNPPTGGGSLWTANADGTGAELLFDHGDRCVEAFHPSWSPDGKRLAFVCYPDEQTATIQVLDPGVNPLVELARVTLPDFIDGQPRWSSDGQTIAFDEIRWDPTTQFVVGSLIATVPAAAGAKVHRLTAFDSFAASPDWSPDDSLLAFNTYDIGNMHGINEASNIYAVAPDGSSRRQVTTASTDGSMRIGMPRWSADGSRIWVSVVREGEMGPSGQPKAEIAWIDAGTGALHELHVEGKGPRPRPTY